MNTHGEIIYSWDLNTWQFWRGGNLHESDQSRGALEIRHPDATVRPIVMARS